MVLFLIAIVFNAIYWITWNFYLHEVVSLQLLLNLLIDSEL